VTRDRGSLPAPANAACSTGSLPGSERGTWFEEPEDPPGAVARIFCDLYFENADLMAVLPFVTGDARTRVLAEMSRLPAGATASPRPAVRATLVQQFGDQAAGRVSYRAEVIVTPPPEAARGTALRTVTFTLVVVPGEGLRSTPWRVAFFQAG